MEDILALLRAAEDRLREADEILAKIDLEASGRLWLPVGKSSSGIKPLKRLSWPGKPAFSGSCWE
jgi:hypothetical protein